MSLLPAQIGGMTPYPQAQQWRVSGKLPDGRPVISQGVVFAYGTQVYQAIIVGENTSEEAIRTFFDALAVQP
jgi:N-acetylneuraminic acid mutarotase